MDISGQIAFRERAERGDLVALRILYWLDEDTFSSPFSIRLKRAMCALSHDMVNELLDGMPAYLRDVDPPIVANNIEVLLPLVLSNPETWPFDPPKALQDARLQYPRTLGVELVRAQAQDGCESANNPWGLP